MEENKDIENRNNIPSRFISCLKFKKLKKKEILALHCYHN